MQTVEAKLRARAANPDPATEAAAAARELTVSFNADCNDGMPWRFLPSQGSVKVCAPPIRLAIFQSTLFNSVQRVHPPHQCSVIFKSPYPKWPAGRESVTGFRVHESRANLGTVSVVAEQ